MTDPMRVDGDFSFCFVASVADRRVAPTAPIDAVSLLFRALTSAELASAMAEMLKSVTRSSQPRAVRTVSAPVTRMGEQLVL